MDEIRSMNSVANPTAAYVIFGGGIDDEGEDGLDYLSETPYNELVPQASTFVGGLSGDVEYYIHAEPAVYPEDFEAITIIREEKGLRWEPNGGIGINTRIFSFPRNLLPKEEIYMRTHVAAECFNEVLGAVIKFCEIPSPSPTTSRTPSKTPSRTPTISVTRTPSGSSSFSRRPSSSASSSPAPSFERVEEGDGCTCLDYGDDTAFGINTLALGNFSGSADTQGRLFVCGDADLRSYSVSDGLPPDSRVDLFVKGDLRFPTGRVYAGDIAYGGEAFLGTSVTQGMYNHTITQDDSVFKCDAATFYYQAYSLNIGTKPATGLASIADDGLLTLTRRGVGNVEIFEVNCTDFAKISKMEFDGVPDGQSVVVNWRGETCDIKELNIVPSNAASTLFNFPEATLVSVKTTKINANMLAPFALLDGSGGVIIGQSVVLNWEGSTQQNYMKCTACLGDLDPWLNPVLF
jgi:choice-of-anchor A domain-containing protein